MLTGEVTNLGPMNTFIEARQTRKDCKTNLFMPLYTRISAAPTHLHPRKALVALPEL